MCKRFWKGCGTLVFSFGSSCTVMLWQWCKASNTPFQSSCHYKWITIRWPLLISLYPPRVDVLREPLAVAGIICWKQSLGVWNLDSTNSKSSKAEPGLAFAALSVYLHEQDNKRHKAEATFFLPLKMEKTFFKQPYLSSPILFTLNGKSGYQSLSAVTSDHICVLKTVFHFNKI